MTDGWSATTTASIGAPMNRVDGPAKVRGEARYTGDMSLAGLVHAVIVPSTIASGTITRIESAAAERVPGVLAVMTPANAPRLPQHGRAAVQPPSGRVLTLLQDAEVHYNGQPIALVIAETFEAATYAAHLVRAHYRERPVHVVMSAALAKAFVYPEKILGQMPPETHRGDVGAALQGAEVVLDAIYTTPIETHNPMEPHGTVAHWSGDQLTLYDSSQYVYGVRRTVARTLGIPDDHVRVITDYVGGAFGSKGSAWSHVVLAAMAAQRVGRPVKLVLTRRQVFGPVGARPHTVQHVVLGARQDGTLVGSRHISTSSTSEIEDWLEPCAVVTRSMYTSPTQETSHRLVKLNVGTPTFNRAPGESTGLFALESAMDELAVSLHMDPIEVRRRNYATTDPDTGRPWSSKALEACYTQAADAFGWSRRTPEPGSMRDGHVRIGYGMASATRPAKRRPASALVRVSADGRALVQAATEDLGTGTYTILTQIAADALGLPPDRVTTQLGDTDYPENPISAGSMTASSAGSAVHVTALAVRDQIIQLAVGDAASPLHDVPPTDVRLQDGRVVHTSDPSRGETLPELLRRHDGRAIEARASSAPGEEVKQYAMNAFGAVFAEVHVDADLGEIRVPRVVGAYGVGRVLNAKTARSQLLGGIVYGISQALLEKTEIDPRSGRYLNTDLSEYLVPVNADIGTIDILIVDETDAYVNPLGVKGLGEVSMTGVAAAIANAVYRATGVRIRSLPITLDRVLEGRAV